MPAVVVCLFVSLHRPRKRGGPVENPNKPPLATKNLLEVTDGLPSPPF